MSSDHRNMDDDFEEKCGESQFSDTDMEYQQRVQRLQHYVPFLKKMIEHLEGAKDKNREAQLVKMRSLLNILTDSHKKLKLETIQRCEDVLQKLYSKVEGAFDWSTGLPSVQTKICLEMDKFSAEREEMKNYNECPDSPLLDSPNSPSKDGDSGCTVWRRSRKTAMDFFDETPRSPSPPSCTEIGEVSKPVLIPMEWNEESNGSSPIVKPSQRKKGLLSKPIEIPLERMDGSNMSTKPVMLPVEQKDESNLPKPVLIHLERKENFEKKWYEGDNKYQEAGRLKNNFGVINSSIPSDPGIRPYGNNLPQSSFSQEIIPRNTQREVSSVASDIPKLDDMRLHRKRGEFEYQDFDKNVNIPYSEESDKWYEDVDTYERRSGKEWGDNAFESRRTAPGLLRPPESPRYVGSTAFYDYEHGQNSPCQDLLENTRESSIESHSEKLKFTMKGGNYQRTSIREKLALEINKVHRVGVSSGGALRSLCKDLGSPSHQRKVENREAVHGSSIGSKSSDDEQSKSLTSERERRLSGCRNLFEENSPTHLPGSKNIDGQEREKEQNKSLSQDRSFKEILTLPLDKNCNTGKIEGMPSFSQKHSYQERTSPKNVCPESQVPEANDKSVIEEFSFRKKRLQKLMSDQRLGSPSVGHENKAHVTSSDADNDEHNSSMSICDEDSDNGSNIFLDSVDIPPPPEPPAFSSPPISPIKHPDHRLISSQYIAPAPHHNANPTIQPFVNPSNPTLPQGSQVDSIQQRNWSAQVVGNSRVFPQGYQQNLMQHHMTSSNINTSGHMSQLNINTPDHMVQHSMNSPNQTSAMDSSHRVQSQYMGLGVHPSHNMNIPKLNQAIRPLVKTPLLPDPVQSFRHGQMSGSGHTWPSMQTAPKVGLLPHPLPRTSWRSESYSRPNRNQPAADPRHLATNPSDSRPHRGRGSWNSRRGSFGKVNDPRLRKPENTRHFPESSDNKYRWKHPADPRHATPTENKPSVPPIQKEKEAVSSPLNSLYEAEQAPKTGKGYGFQKFRIPKLKSQQTKKNITNPRPISPPREVNVTPKEKNVVEDTQKEKVEESKKEEEVSKTKEEFTKDLFETLLKMSLSSGEGTKILENSKFIDELRDKLKLNRPKKRRPIIESDSEPSEEEEELKPSQVVTKVKKRSRLIIESSESEESAEEKEVNEVHKNVRRTASNKTSAGRTPRSCRKANQIFNLEKLGGRPRTRSQRKFFSIEEEEEEEKNESEKHTVEAAVEENEEEVFQNLEKEKEIEDHDVNEEIKTKTAAKRTKRRSSLELLQEDIREMFICEGVMSATGVRMCRLLKEAASASNVNVDTSYENDASRDSEEWEEKSHASSKNDRDIDQCEDSGEDATAKSTKKKVNKKGKGLPPTSLQPRVVLKKTEINAENKDSFDVAQTGKRGRGNTRRSRKKPQNIGNRRPNSATSLGKCKNNIIEDTPEESIGDEEFEDSASLQSIKDKLNAQSEECKSTSDLPKFVEDENEKDSKSSYSESTSSNDKNRYSSESNKSILDSDEDENSSKKDNSSIKDNKNCAEKCIDKNVDSDSSENALRKEDDDEPEMEEGDIDSEHSMKEVNDEAMEERADKVGLKKQKCKKRSKVNRRWALGILKRAVNHKRRSIPSFPAQSVFSTESNVSENLVEPLPNVDLADINYFSNGSESVPCKLCSYQGKQIVGHYVTKHPESEVLVSRLSADQAKIAWDWTEANKGALKNAREVLNSSGPFVCIICEAWHTDYAQFYDHVTTHTGEYRYSCKLCSYRSFRGTNVRSHSYYIHRKKWSESSQCYTAVSVDLLINEEQADEHSSENSSTVIPGLVAHLCSKCHFVQISEKGVVDHIQKMHKEEDVAKVLKIDMSLIAPEPSSNLSLSGDFVKADLIPQETINDKGIDEENSRSSVDNSVCSEKENTIEDKSKTFIPEEILKIIKKEEEYVVEDTKVKIESDDTVFKIEDDLYCEPDLIGRAEAVWHEVLETPAFDEDIIIIRYKLHIKLEEDEEESSPGVESAVNNVIVKSDTEDGNNLLEKSVEVKEEAAKEQEEVDESEVLSAKKGKEMEEGKPLDVEAHSSDIEIIEINDDSDDSSDSDYSSDSESSSSEDEGVDDTSEKENLFALDIIPEVKVQTTLIDITDKISTSISKMKDLENLASISEDFNDKNEMAVEEPQSDPSQSCAIDKCDPVPDSPPKFKIRVRCLSGDLLSSNKEPKPEEGSVSSDADPYIDVIGTSPVFEPDADNTLCQISSVCSLHPNEQVPEDFIKAVSENEPPDLNTLAAYSPSTAPVYFIAPPSFSSSQPIESVHSQVVGVPVINTNASARLIPIAPKSHMSNMMQTSYPNTSLGGTNFLPQEPVGNTNAPRLRTIAPKPHLINNSLYIGSGIPKFLPQEPQNVSNGKGFKNENTVMPTKKSSCNDSSVSQTMSQSPNQAKVCSVMRACLYAKASKTPAVFNQVINNQMKLCHLFKCMGRQCSFTTDEPIVFLSHYLGHESLESGAASSTGGCSAENSEKQERRFDWQQCCYCAEMFSSGSAHVKHVQTEHGECIYQCPYCFYRAAAVSYVILHQNSTHITEKVSVLHCKAPGKVAGAMKDSSPLKPNIEAYVCYQGNCKRSFYSPSKYLSHLQLEHSAVSIYCCHKCSFQCLKADRLLQHYKLHSFYLYQCVYCEQGSDTSEEILQHLASFHPNKRATVCKRNSQANSNGSARTTGRHVYILYEDIELTEMDDVDVVPVGLPGTTNTSSTSPMRHNEIPEKKNDDKHAENENDLVDVEDGNSDYDDEDNLIIAEEPEEMSSNANESRIEEDSEIVEIPGSSEETGNEDEVNVIEENKSEEVNEMEKENGMDEENEIELLDSSEVSEIPLAEQNIISSKASSLKESSITSSSDEVKNSDQCEVVENENPKRSAAADNIIEVEEDKAKTLNIDIIPCITKEDDVSEKTASMSPAKPQLNSKNEEDHSNATKKNVSLKEAANSKVDRANLYQCCFSGCIFLGRDIFHLKHHVRSCPHAKECTKYACPHCGRMYKYLPSLLKHYRVHGKKSFVCMICKFQGSHAKYAVQHVKSRHRATATTVSPLTDWQEPDDLPLTSKDHKLIVVAPREVSMSFLLRKRFLPEDADYLPFPCIYNREAKCARCSYSTRIRSNMRRHLYLHLKFNKETNEGNAPLSAPDLNQVPWSDKDRVNPMPCLEGKEMMFDKMTNWANSSHVDDNIKEEERSEGRRDSLLSNYEDDNFIPRFVPENERYVCGVIGCHYQTVDDMMLRHHLRALHREEATFRCAHCPDDPNIIHQVQVDRLAAHLKMHDDRLYQCIHCNYFHFQRRFVERHTMDKHSDMSQMVNVIREPDTFARTANSTGTSGMAGTSTDGSIRSSNPSVNDCKTEEDNLWHCSLCSYSCSHRESISDHARISHSLSSQYVCTMCSFRSAYLTSFSPHFSSKHPGYPVQLIANYFRHNISVLASPSITIILPNGKVIHPPGPETGKSGDPRSEPVIEIWPFVEKGFGKSSSSSVRLKELNTTYPWQRCMPKVRYIRGIPIAEEGEETMYDLAESLKVKDEVNEGTHSVEVDVNASPADNTDQKKLKEPVVEDEVTIIELEDNNVSIMDHFSDLETKISGKRRQNDADTIKLESYVLENKRKAENVRSAAAAKNTPTKKTCDRSHIEHPSPAKMPKIEFSIKKSPNHQKSSNALKAITADHVEEKMTSKSAEDKEVEKKVKNEKVESLKQQFGECGRPDGKLFSCPKCRKYKTKYKGDMKEHLFRELNYKRYVCTHCGLMSPAKGRLQKHYVRVHQKDGKPEAIASLRPDKDIELWVNHTLSSQFKTMKQMKLSMSDGTDEAEGMLEAMSTSIKSPTEEGASSKTQYCCKHCMSRFSSIRGLKIHVKIFHLKLGSWICGHCDVTANSQVIISKHCKSSHPDKEELVLSNNLGSFMDSKFWEDYGLLEDHLLINELNDASSVSIPESPTMKSSCNYQTEQRDDSYQHEMPQLVQKSYKCETCNFISDQECDIKSHSASAHPSTVPKVTTNLSSGVSELKHSEPFGQRNDDSSNPADVDKLSIITEVDNDRGDDIEVVEEGISDDETLITMENIDEYGKPNPLYMFKCYYCRMKSLSCSDVLNHWEHVHHRLASITRKVRPFKCKKVSMSKVLQEKCSSGQVQLYHCAYCQESGSILHLKEHFSAEHSYNDFKVGNINNTTFCCLHCDYVSNSLAVLANHFESTHPSRNFEYEVKSENTNFKILEESQNMKFALKVEGTKNGNEQADRATEEEFLKNSLFRCYWCSEEFGSLKTVQSHHSKRHTRSPLKYLIEVKPVKVNESPVPPKSSIMKNVVKIYHCPSCTVKMTSFLKMFEHLRQHALPFKCGTCNFGAEVPSKIREHHLEEHPLIPSPLIVPDANAENEMHCLWKKIKVIEEPFSSQTGVQMKRRALSPLTFEPKKHCPVARKSTTYVNPNQSVWKATARKSTNPSAMFIRNLKSMKESSSAEHFLPNEFPSQREPVIDACMVGEWKVCRNEEFSFYNGGKSVAKDSVDLSRITVWMTFGGCAAKRVPVSKMAQLVDLSPNLYIEDFRRNSKEDQGT